MGTTVIQHIEKTPGVCGGKARVAGTRIRVEDIYVWFELQHRSAEEIVADFPQLSMADVFAAMAYYWDHRDEIEQQRTEARTAATNVIERDGRGRLSDIWKREPGV